MLWVPAAAAVVLAAATAGVTPALLKRLPEPADTKGEEKTPYAALATRRFVSSVALSSLVAALLAFYLIPPAGWPAWAALAGPGALAVAIDGHTTWIPRLLTTVMAAVAAAGVGVWSVRLQDPALALRAGLGAVAVGGFFYLFWVVTRGIGFADVRLMAVVGAVTAAHSTQLAVWSVLLGTAVGAVFGILRRLARGPGEFPYGPSLWAGPFLALLASLVL